MRELILVFIAGFAASFVDGALGMGFGPTSSSILLSTGLSPAATSTVVNLAKVATGLAAGVAHWRFKNIDRRLVLRLAGPGCIGALIGVTVLANVDGKQLKPILAALLLVVAARILLRFSNALPARRLDADGRPIDDASFDDGPLTLVAGGAGGVTNGLIGAWGPVVTPYLLGRGLAPRFAIGSVNTAEVAVAVVASGSLLATLGGDGVNPATVVAMLLGGALAAPIAAWAIRYLPARAMGVGVGGLLLLTNMRELSNVDSLHAFRWPAYAAAVTLTALAALRPLLAGRRAVQMTA